MEMPASIAERWEILSGVILMNVKKYGIILNA